MLQKKFEGSFGKEHIEEGNFGLTMTKSKRELETTSHTLSNKKLNRNASNHSQVFISPHDEGNSPKSKKSI